MLKKKTLILGGLIAALGACVIFATSQGLSSALVEVSLCLPISPASGLPLIAEEKGFFKDHGLKVQIQMAELGKDCVQKLQNHQVDFAASNVPPLASAIGSGAPLIVLTELASSNRNTSLVMLKPLSASTTENDSLKNKKIGLVENTNSETFLRLYSKARDLDRNGFSIVQTQTLKELGVLLQKGEVQAAVMWEPFLTKFLKSAQPNSFVTQDSSFYSQFCVLGSSQQMASEHPEVIENLMRALIDSQKFNDSEGARAQDIMMARLHYQPADMPPEVWAKFQLKLGLSAVLISMMKESQIPLNADINWDDSQSSAWIMRSLFPQSLRKVATGLVTYE